MIVYIILVALCAASISYTISYTSIFLGFREWISKFHHKLEELIHCPYCLCHYIILTIMFTTNDISSKLVPIANNIVYDFLFTWFCIVCITSLLHCVMLIAYRPIMQYMTDRKIAKIKQRKKEA